MKIIQSQDLEKFQKTYRTKLINSLLGPKPIHLIGTKSKDNYENLAPFSSLVHLGANPSLIGQIHRPITEYSHTYKNIINTGYYTVNQVCKSFIKNAHYTSTRLEKEESEFEKCKLKTSYKNDFFAPFIKESTVKIGMKMLEDIFIKHNNTHFIIGEIQFIIFENDCILEDGTINSIENEIALVNGLEQYYESSFMEQFAYASKNNLPQF